MSDTPRLYKWYPTVSCDLGTMPFQGDWTENDRIHQIDALGIWINYTYSPLSGFGRTVQKKVGNRLKTVFEPGVKVGPMELSGHTYPVYFRYFGDGVCTVKIPEGELEPVEE